MLLATRVTVERIDGENAIGSMDWVRTIGTCGRYTIVLRCPALALPGRGLLMLCAAVNAGSVAKDTAAISGLPKDSLRRRGQRSSSTCFTRRA